MNMNADVGPHFVDVHVGAKIKEFRIIRAMTQHQLAEPLGISFQQVQKYESGANRVSASMMYHIADTLNQPVCSFFPCNESEMTGEQEGAQGSECFVHTKESLELVRLYFSMKPEARRAFLAMMKSLSL